MRTICIFILCACSSIAQIITLNNAVGSTYSKPGTIAPNMLATVTQVFAGFGVLPVLPSTTDARVFIRPFGSSSKLPATIVGASPGSVTFIVPPDVPTGSAELAWQAGSGPYRSINVTVAQSNFELAAGARVLNADGTTSKVGLATPVRPGQTILLSGSGLGYNAQVTAMLGNLSATVAYAGRSASPGYDEIRIQIPAGVAGGCYAPLNLTIGSMSLVSLIPVTSDGSACQHPFQLSLKDLQNLDAGGTLAAAEIDMSTQLNVATPDAIYRDEYMSMSVSTAAAGDIARLIIPNAGPAGCSIAAPPAGDLLLLGSFSGIQAPAPLPPDFGKSVMLTSGSDYVLDQIPAGQAYYPALPSPQDGSLTKPPLSIIAPNKWTWSSSGSADIAPSSFSFSLAAPVQLGGSAPVVLQRDRDQTLTWISTGIDAGAMAIVDLSGQGAGITCTASAASGSVTIPAALLSTFPAGSMGSVTLREVPSGISMPHVLLQTKAGNTVLMVVSYTPSDNRPVDFR